MRWRIKSPASWLFTSSVCSGADQRKHQSSALLALVRGIHRWPVNSPHKGPVKRKMYPFNDVIMADKPSHKDCSTRMIGISRYKNVDVSFTSTQNIALIFLTGTLINLTQVKNTKKKLRIIRKSKSTRDVIQSVHDSTSPPDGLYFTW